MKLLLKIKEEKNYQTSIFVPKRSVLHKHVSFEISRILISQSKPFTDGSIIHECLIKTMEILYPKYVPEVKRLVYQNRQSLGMLKRFQIIYL